MIHECGMLCASASVGFMSGSSYSRPSIDQTVTPPVTTQNLSLSYVGILLLSNSITRKEGVLCRQSDFKSLFLRLLFWWLGELEALGDLEDLGDDDIALGPHLEVKTCNRFRLKTIIRLISLISHQSLSVVLVRCRHLQDLLVLQGTTRTRVKSQELLETTRLL